jgi:hypothetical protein
MKIAPIQKGFDSTTDHILLTNADELATIIEVFVNYCEVNKRKKKAKKMLKQFEDECAIF